MPRAAWVALGVIGGAGLSQAAALVVPSPAAAIAAAGLWVIVAATIAAASGRRAGDHWAFAVTVGGVLVAIRIVVLAGAPPGTPPTGSGSWDATVTSVSSMRDGAVPAVLSIAAADGALEVSATLPAYPVVGPGDRVRVRGEVRAPTTRDDRPRLFVRSVERTAETPAIEALRRAVGDAIARVVPEPHGGLAAGMIVGLRERVDRDLATAFTAAGVSHVVAISGWNVSLVIAALAPLALRLPRRTRAVVLIGAISLFVAFAGGSASVVRAALMTGVVLVARAAGRSGSAAAALAWAVVALIVADPAEVADPGLQLSAGATIGLLLWGGPIQAWLRTHLPARLPDTLVESLALSLAAEAMTLPFVLADFGRLSLIAPAANLAVAPFVAPAMVAGAVAAAGGLIVAAGVPGAIGTVLALPAWAVLGTMIAVVRIAAAVPFASVTLPAPFGPVAGLVAAAPIVWLSARPHRRPTAAPAPSPGHARMAGGGSHAGRSGRSTAAIGVTALLVISLGVTAASVAAKPPGTVRVTVLDVGQGDAILVESDGGSRMLLDGGPDPSRLLAALDGHLPPWDRRIDVLVLTHPHEDHAAGLPALVERFRVGAVYEPGMHGPGPGYRAFEAALRAAGAASGRLTTGDRLALDHLDLRVLWPDRGSVPDEPGDDGTSINNVSIVLLGTFGAQRMLLAGDIEQEIDPILLAHRVPHVDLLKVAHHGSPTSSTAPFLAAVRPKVAVVSVGAKNRYGHPSPATVDRLREAGAAVYRTDRNGSVEVDLDGRDTLVSRERGDADDGRRASGPQPSVPLFACSIAVPARGSVEADGSSGSATAGYDRADDGARSSGGHFAPLVARPTDLGGPACASGRGSRSLARARRRLGTVRSRSGRGGGAAARRRQAPAGRQPGPLARPWTGVSGMARGPGPP